MKSSLSSLIVTGLAFVCLVAIGCGREETVDLPSDIVTTAPPSTSGVSDHDHEHDHKHGPNGYPVVDMNDGTEIEWEFDEDAATFLLVPPTEMADKIQTITVKSVVEGTENLYTFNQGEQPGTWTMQNQELGTAMMMGDAVERTLTITLSDGTSLTAPVAHFEGH